MLISPALAETCPQQPVRSLFNRDKIEMACAASSLSLWSIRPTIITCVYVTKSHREVQYRCDDTDLCPTAGRGCHADHT
jgi:hypothetical protein